MKHLLRKALPDAIVVVAFLIIAILYFFTPLSEGLVLGGHDTVAGMGQGHEQQLYREATGEFTRWTNSIFSGMPTYQIAPSYGPTTLLGHIAWVIGLFTTGPLNYLFIYLLGFYILMRSFSLRPAISALGATLWAFSSYFFIIIAAGHIWKVNTLGFIPPTIAGLVLAYRGKYLWGLLVTALFTALQVLSNHLQMTYYFLFPMAFICLAYGVEAIICQRRAAAASAEVASAESPSAKVAVGNGGVSNTADSAADSAAAAPSPLRHWLRATAAIILGGLLGAAVNLPNLYHTYDYTHHSMRGPAELTAANPAANTAGLDRDYITAWSYGIDETLTLLIPMYKGGGSTSILDRDDADQLPGYTEWYQHAAATQEATQGQLGAPLPGMLQYWGDQPMTVGPVYVGAIVCFLFILSLFVVRGPMKWALLLATILSLTFAWGRNIMPVTDFLIDHLPMYNKFRTVSSALVVAEFTMPLLAILGLAHIISNPADFLRSRRAQLGLLISFTLTAGTTLILTLAPSLAHCISHQDETIIQQLQQSGLPIDFCESYRQAIITLHGSILSASALRSFLLILAAAGAILAYCRLTAHNKSTSAPATPASAKVAVGNGGVSNTATAPLATPAYALIAFIFILSIVDMWNINRHYLNDNNFQTENTRLDGFQQTPADRTILTDTDPNYRVLNLAAGNPFNESDNHTAYWHKSIGGYHAAKLHRYQDLIDHHLNNECQRLAAAINHSYNIIISDSIATQQLYQDAIAAAPNDTDPQAYAQQQLYDRVMQQVGTDTIAPVLNMLNAKWLIMGQGGQIALRNPAAQGNAWLITDLTYVDTPDAEINALATLDLRHQAVADNKFQEALGQPYHTTHPATEATIRLTTYQPNELHYTLDTPKEGVVAFSEVYYPGWTATIDGNPAPLGRVNYILRALRVPAGKHEVILTFRPTTITTTNAIAYTALALLLLGFIYATYRTLRPIQRRRH